jgi:quercetin dioxygenase-like cupin family protein
VLTWNLLAVEAPDGTRDPHVVHQDEGARGVLVVLQPGQSLDDHEVRENTWAIVVEGAISVSAGTGNSQVQLRQGSLVHLDAGERRSITSAGGARLLLIFTPWPGSGHYSPAEQESRNVPVDD